MGEIMYSWKIDLHMHPTYLISLQSKKFFDLPQEHKMLAPHPPGGAHHRGYSPMGLEKVTQNVFDPALLHQARQLPDLKESFESGNPLDSAQPNIWPPDHVLPGFKAYVLPCFLQPT